MTFGNDKIITTKGWRPSFGISEGEITKILRIPVRVIEKSMKIIENSGENKEKTDLMNQIEEYRNYSQALKTKINSLFTQKTFYPGQKLVTEG